MILCIGTVKPSQDYAVVSEHIVVSHELGEVEGVLVYTMNLEVEDQCTHQS